jgi:hypothetical protein
VRSIARDSFNELETGSHGLTDEKEYWEFEGEVDSQGKYTRRVEIEDVLRDDNGDIVGEGTRDIHTRKITTTVGWDTLGRHISLAFTNYITDWDNQRIFEDTAADFNDGTFDKTQVTENADGEVELKNAPGTFECSPFVSSLNLKKARVGTDPTVAYDTTISGKVAYVVSSDHSGTGAGRRGRPGAGLSCRDARRSCYRNGRQHRLRHKQDCGREHRGGRL